MEIQNKLIVIYIVADLQFQIFVVLMIIMVMKINRAILIISSIIFLILEKKYFYTQFKLIGEVFD